MSNLQPVRRSGRRREFVAMAREYNPRNAGRQQILGSKLAPAVSASNLKQKDQMSQLQELLLSEQENLDAPIDRQTVRMSDTEDGLDLKRRRGNKSMVRLSGQMNFVPIADQLEDMRIATDEFAAQLHKVHRHFDRWHPVLGQELSEEAHRKSRASKVEKNDDEPDLNDLAERLAQYKYVRVATVGEELPPLSRKNIAPELPPKPPQENFVDHMERNRSPGQLQLCKPNMAADRRGQMFRSHSAHVFSVQQKEEKLFQEEMRRRKQALALRHPVIKATSASSRSSVDLGTGAEANDCSRMTLWFSMIACMGFLEQCQAIQEEIPAEVDSSPGGWAEAVTVSPKARRKAPAAMADRLEEALWRHATSKVSPGVAFLLSMLVAKVKVWRQRRKARMVWESMNQWRVTGKFMLYVRMYQQKMRKLQRWWQARQQYLSTATNAVAKRFREHEHQILTRDIKARMPPRASMIGGLSIEEKVELEMLSDEVVVRFIRNELKYRRYILIPAVDRWNDDMDRYCDEVDEWRLNRKACKALGTVCTDRMPDRPAYPSYWPPDDDIRQMYVSARRAPNGWHKIPRKAHGFKATDTLEKAAASQPAVVSRRPSVSSGTQQTPAIAVEAAQRVPPNPQDFDEAIASFELPSYVADPANPAGEPGRGTLHRVILPSSVCIYEQTTGQLNTPRPYEGWEENPAANRFAQESQQKQGGAQGGRRGSRMYGRRSSRQFASGSRGSRVSLTTME